MRNSTKKTFVTKEQIAMAKRPDLFSYLRQYEPDELVHISGNIYCTKTHDSLKISNGKWFWWSRWIGGRSALDYLIKVRDMPFVDAVLHLCGNERFIMPTPTYTSKPKPKEPFFLPERAENNDKVVEYLMARGISLALIRICINRGMLYQSKKHDNCCFVGFDYDGKAQYAMLRSSHPDSTFMQDIAGSNKEYSFSLPINPNCNTLYVFESAIDLLSFATIRMMNKDDVTYGNYLSLSGVYQPKNDVLETPLPAALARFLKENDHIRRISLRFDADKTGRIAADTLQALLGKSYEVSYDPPECGKDFNAMLMGKKQLSGINTRKSSKNLKEETR